MKRPEDLPDFANPPLVEVVLGVQFKGPSEFMPVHTQAVWELYKKEFPDVQSRPPLISQFEVFGGSLLQPGAQVSLGNTTARDRLWFISKNKDRLIQFQDDRLLFNWRKQSDSQKYPRYEVMANQFSKYLETLEAYFLKRFSHAIKINQAEVSYINIIQVENLSQVGKWISLFGNTPSGIENINFTANQVIRNRKGDPMARLTHELQSMVYKDGEANEFRLSLTFRGIPQDGDRTTSMRLIGTGRETIVRRFTDITTSDAHREWRRIQ